MSDKETLESLGVCDEALAGLRREQREIPVQVSGLETRVELARGTIVAEEQRLADSERRHRELEGELQDTESQRSKFQSQTALVKTNAEYTTLLREIDQSTARIGEIEEQILILMDRNEELRSEVAATVEREQASARDMEKRISERQARLVEVEQELVTRGGELEVLLERVEPRVRGHYARVCKARGNGVARIRGITCGACNRDVPFEVINRVAAGEFHSCGACQRILLGEEP
jgi:predicted  nucleic acid-binding Zn-ribbon protein